MLVAVLVVHLAQVLYIHQPGQGQVPCPAQRVFRAGRIHASEFVRKAQVDVIQEPTDARAVVPGRIESLNDVLLASLPVPGRGRQIPHVDQQVLCPVLKILRLCGPFRVLPDPVANVMREPPVELVEVPRDHESILADVAAVADREQFGLPFFNRKIDGNDAWFSAVAVLLSMDTPLSKGIEFMRASVRKGRDELAGRVQAALCLYTKKEAEHVVNAVVSCLECMLLEHLATDAFTLKLGGFGKFSIRHKPGILRKIPFTGATVLTKAKRKVKFVSLGVLRQRESQG
jgi:nucleoid DNA-binding protein